MTSDRSHASTEMTNQKVLTCKRCFQRPFQNRRSVGHGSKLSNTYRRTYSSVPTSSGKHNHSWSSHSGWAGTPVHIKLRFSHTCRWFLNHIYWSTVVLYLFRLLVVSQGSLGLSVVKVERVVVVEVTLQARKIDIWCWCFQCFCFQSKHWYTSYLDWVEIYKHILKLFQQEETGGHTLPARYCVL